MKKLALTFGLLLLSAAAFAAPENVLDTGNTAWMLMAAAMVMLMTPAGLALFYSGLTQNKAVLNTMGMTYVAFCTGTLTWVVIGYTLAFGEGSFIGGLEYFMLNGIKLTDIVEGAGIPKFIDVAFQGMFASIAVAIVSGSIIERVRFLHGHYSLFFGWLLYMRRFAIGCGEALLFFMATSILQGVLLFI